jgi:hypothetical protein
MMADGKAHQSRRLTACPSGIQFVIVHSVQLKEVTSANSQKPIDHIVGSALAVAGTSITITTATDAVAFYTGCFSALPEVSSFTAYAGTCVLCDFLLQITYFPAILSFDCHRIRVCKTFIVLSWDSC